MNEITRAQRRKLIAEEILTELDIVNKWSHFGRVVLVGSFAFDLLVSPDIDMEVYCSELRIEDGFRVLSECAQNKRVTKARFSNKLGNTDNGLYWQLRFKYYDGTEWKLDMWSVSQDYDLPRGEDLIAPINKCLTREKRQTILELKELRMIDDRLECPSIDLYRAILDDGVKTANDLILWLSSHKTGELTSWRPFEKR